MKMQIPFVGKKFFTTSYEYSYGGTITVKKQVFTSYADAQNARNFSYPRTDSFVRAWDSREEAEKYLASREEEK